MCATFSQAAWTRPSRHRAIADDVVTPRGHKLRVKKRDGAIPLLDDRVKHVVGFTVEYNRRAGFRLDVYFIELRLALTDQRRQNVGRQRVLGLVPEAMPRSHVAKQDITELSRLVVIEPVHRPPLGVEGAEGAPGGLRP